MHLSLYQFAPPQSHADPYTGSQGCLARYNNNRKAFVTAILTLLFSKGKPRQQRPRSRGVGISGSWIVDRTILSPCHFRCCASASPRRYRTSSPTKGTITYRKRPGASPCPHTSSDNASVCMCSRPALFAPRPSSTPSLFPRATSRPKRCRQSIWAGKRNGNF